MAKGERSRTQEGSGLGELEAVVRSQLELFPLNQVLDDVTQLLARLNAGLPELEDTQP